MTISELTSKMGWPLNKGVSTRLSKYPDFGGFRPPRFLALNRREESEIDRDSQAREKTGVDERRGLPTGSANPDCPGVRNQRQDPGHDVP